MNRIFLAVAVIIGAATMAAPAFAYVGPGAGLSLLGALWGLLLALFAAIGFIVGWPVRRWLRRRRAASGSASAAASLRQSDPSRSPKLPDPGPAE